MVNTNFEQQATPLKTFRTSFSKISDHQLFVLCQKYGEQARRWKQKFAGLLPEVFRRKLYEKKGFGSIFEFAAKLAGMSAEQVRLVLNLEKKFEDKPILKRMLIEGEVSMNKLARIKSVATAQNEEFLAAQIKLLPNRAIETLVRDVREHNNPKSVESKCQDGLFETKIDLESLHVQTLKLDKDVENELIELQAKGIDINDLLREFLEQRREKIAERKQQISEKVLQEGPTQKRYISVEIKKIIKEEHGTKCTVPNCPKPAINIHHTQRFGLTQNHDPQFLAPLCHEHHLIAHSLDLKLYQIRARR